MRKIYFVMLTVLFAAISNAQTPQYFKGTGTSTNTIPMNTTGSHCQQLYLPSDFNTTPISGLITKIWFRNSVAGGTGTYTNFSVAFIQNSLTAFPNTTFLTGLTTALSSPSITINGNATAGGWYEILLTTPYLYDNTQTLIVEIKYDSKVGGMSGFTTTATGNKRLSIVTAPGPLTGNLSTLWGDWGMDLIPATPCTSPPTPGTATASPTPICTGTSVNLNLTGHTQGMGQTYVWESAAAIGGPYTPISPSSSFSNLTVNPTVTTYYRAAVTCSGNTQTSVPVQVVVNPALPGGTYTINPALPPGGGNYQTIAAAVSALSCGIAGPVIFNVAPGSGPYNEQVIVPIVGGTSAVNTVTFYGNGATIQATPVTATRHIIRLDGADYITFRKFNLLAQAGSTFGWGVHLTNGADNNTIDSCTIDVSAVTSTTQSNSAGIVGSGSTTSVTTAGSASNNTISNNTIIGGYQGIILIGTATSLNSLNNTITKNEVRDWLVTGIEITHANGGVISYNNIHRTNRADVATTISQGIEFGAGNINCIINGNRIHDSHTATATQSGTFYGIYANACDATAGSENRVINNLIYKINSLTGTIYGLYNSSSDGVYYYHNTVVLDHAAATAGITRGFYQLTLSTNIQFRNNIVIIARGGTGVKYCLYFGTTTSTILSNNNVLLNTATGGTNGIGSFGTTGYTTLIDWQGANGNAYDQQSISVDPAFNSPGTGDYTPTAPSVNNIGAPVGVTTDILQAPRSGTTPDPGAYEFNIAAGINMGAQSLVTPAVSPNGCYTSAEIVTIKIKNSDINPINFTVNPVTVTTNVTGAVTQTLTAVVNTGTLGAGLTLDVPMTGTLNMNPTGVYTFNAFTTVTGDVNPGNDAMIPVNITKAVLAAGTASANPNQFCVTGAPTLSATGITGYGNLQWQQSITAGSGFTDIPGATTSPYTVSPISQTMYYRLVASCNGNSVMSNEVTATVNNPQITSTTPGASCGPGPVTVTLAATGSGPVLNWYDVPSGGVAIGTGSPFTTPPISATTNYWVSSGDGGTSGNVGPLNNAIGTGAGSTILIGTQQLFFDVLAPSITINTVTIYPTATVGSSFTIVIQNSSAVQVYSSGPMTTTVTGGTTPQVVTLNAVLPAGTGYRFGFSTNPGMWRNDAGAVYPYTLPGVVSITGNSFNPVYYYWFYNWSVSSGCEGLRTMVTATVTPPPSATISYGGSPYCTNAGIATVTQTGTTGGTYSSIAGLTINAANGNVTLGTSIPGTYTVTYTIPASGGCPLYTTTTSITVNNCGGLTSDLSISKTDGATTYTAGGTTTYTIIASNNGPNISFGATVNDNFPAAITSVAWTVVYAGGASGPANGVGNINATINLPVGGTATFTAVCSISSGATGNLVNTATIAVLPGDTDPNPGNNSATDTDTPNPQADLSISKTDGSTTAVPGSTTIYTITVNNNGPSNVTGATVTDNFAAIITSANWTAVYAGGATGPASGSGNINATVNIPSGGSITFTVTCNISAIATGSLSNTATVTAPASTTDPNPGNNTAIDTDTLTPTADLTIIKTDGVVTYTPGGTTTYTIIVSNNGPSNVIGAIVTDNFPAAITGISWTAVYAGGASGPASGASNISVLVNTPVGGSATFTAVCTISPGASGNLVNTATVTAPAGTTDPIPGNNSATDTDSEGAAPIITVNGTLTPFTTCAGTPSAEQTFTVSGTNLSANLVITAPAGFEVSITSGSGFSGSISLIPVGGNVSATTIYVRLSASASGTPSGNITCSSTGAITQNVPVSGTVNPTPNAVATPSSQIICSASPITTIVLSGAVSGTTYAWTRNNLVNLTGIAASGNGNISGTLTNTTSAVQTTTFTITPTANGCPGAPITATVTVNPTPTVSPVPPNQTVCNTAPTAPVIFSGPVAGTTFNWVNNTPSIGLAASGTGNIASFNAINLTNTPVTATITVTPVTTPTGTVTFNYTGAFQTFVVPAGVTSVNIQASGAQGMANAAGVSLGGLGGSASGNLAVTAGETLWVYVGGGGTTSATGGFNGGGNGGTTGTCLTALGGGGGGASDVRQTTNTLADRKIVAGGGGGTAGNRVAACARGAGGGGGGGYYGGGGGCGYPGTTGVVPTGGTQVAGGAGGITGTTFGATNGLPGVLGIGGAGGNEIFSAQAASQAVIFGSGNGGGLTGAPGQQSGLNNFTGQSGGGGSSYIGGVTGGSTTAGVRSGNGVVTISYATAGPTCTGPSSSFTITVNPTPNAVAAPTTQTICSGTAMTPIVLTGNVSGTVFNWTRDNQVNVTGIPNAGSGNISGTPINNTTVQQTVTFTITPVANGCPGAPITATLIVNKAPTITCPANITVNNTTGQCGANVTYPPATATGSPAPVITYSQASGSFFPVGTTTVTATATNVCGVATCTFTITVLDVQTPTITCPANIVANTDVGACVATVATPNPTTGDNCAVTAVTWVMTGATTGSSPATGINYVGTRAFNLNGTTGQGVTTITYTVRDAAGNTATCSFTVTVNDAWIPVIGGQPGNQTVCVGSNALFSVTASVPAGNPLTYQWQTWNGSAWVNITGATNATLPLSAVTLSMNTNSYRVILTGRCSVVTSAFASLYVNALPAVSILASMPPILLPTQSVTLTAIVNPGGGTYQWFKNGVAIPGATGASLAGLTVNDIGTYKVVYTDPNGCVATSADIVVSAQQSAHFYVYPNPNDGLFHIRFYNQANEQVTVNLYDSKGALVYNRKTITTTPYTDITVDISNLPAGTYTVELRNASGKSIGAKKIIVYDR